MFIFISGSTLWACILQCLYNTLVCPAADLPSWPLGSDASSPPACSPHHAQHAVQASDQLWQCWFWLYSHTTSGPAAITPQGLWAQPQKACQLWGGMWVSGFHLAKNLHCNVTVCRVDVYFLAACVTLDMSPNPQINLTGFKLVFKHRYRQIICFMP